MRLVNLKSLLYKYRYCVVVTGFTTRIAAVLLYCAVDTAFTMRIATIVVMFQPFNRQQNEASQR
jgi:hypothetical protein